MVGESCESKPFSITYKTTPSENPTLKAPSFAFTEKPFTVAGETPEPNQTVWIELETILLDERIAQGVSDANRKFEMEVQLSDVGVNKIHSEIETWGLNKTSPTRSVLTLNYMTAGLLLVIVLFMGYKLYQKHGGKKGGRKKK